MKKAGVIALLIMIVLALPACSAKTTPTAPAAREGDALLPNMLVQVEGKVLLRRAGWIDFIPAGFGTLVAPGDLLRVDEGSAAGVFCGADGSWEKGASPLAADGSEHGVPCSAGRPPRPWSDVVALRGEADAGLPYVISPRNSALLSDLPLLRWHPLLGVESYTVTLVSDDGQERPARQASAAWMEWPSGWAPLQAGASYVLVVEAGGKRSDGGSQGNVGVGFWLLPEKDAQAVREQAARLRSAGLAPQAADLLVAELYTHYALHAEASALLEALAPSQGAASVWLGLGQSYLQAGLAAEASEAYQQALALAQGAGEREAEAAAQVGAGLAARLRNDPMAAQAAFAAAQSLYELIGDQAAIGQVKELLSK